MEVPSFVAKSLIFAAPQSLAVDKGWTKGVHTHISILAVEAVQ